MAEGKLLATKRRLYTATQLASATGIGRTTLYQRIKDGLLAYDAKELGRPCFSYEAALAFAKAERERRAARTAGAS